MKMDFQLMLSQVISWNKSRQYKPTVQLSELLIEGPIKDLSLVSSSPKELASQQTKSSLYNYFGDALFELRYYQRSVKAFEQALKLSDTGTRRSSKRCKTTSYDTSRNTEIDLKLKIHKCYIELNENIEARRILESVPVDERNTELMVALADLYMSDKNIDAARETYLAVLKQDPLRMDLITDICKIGGCDTNTILTLIPDDVQKIYPWYTIWIQAQFALHSPSSKQAIRLFETLTSRFEKKAPILINLAKAHYYDGNYREASRIYQIAYTSDPLTISGIDCYAACLHKEQSESLLADLATIWSSKCSVIGEHSHEPWLVLAHYYASIDKKEPKALLFAQKAFKVDPHCIETLVLITCLYLEKKDFSKALSYITTAFNQAPYRYEVQSLYCAANLADNKKALALKYARYATKTLKGSARSYYLLADVILKIQRCKSSAKKCLEKSVRLDSLYLPAVFAYTEILIEEKKIDKAIEVLKHAAREHGTNVDLNRYLCTCYNEKKDSDKALHYKTLASDITTHGSHYDNIYGGSNNYGSAHEAVDELPGLEADEPMDHGDSEVDDTNLES